jgi:hypothetical protein
MKVIAPANRTVKALVQLKVISCRARSRLTQLKYSDFLVALTEEWRKRYGHIEKSFVESGSEVRLRNA